jgi:uncharacterized protein (DUF169 family)
MNNNREYARRLKEREGYERKIIAFKLCDTVPNTVEPYGDDLSFHCALVAEVWEGRKPFYLTGKNVLCGGAVHSGMCFSGGFSQDKSAGEPSLQASCVSNCRRS